MGSGSERANLGLAGLNGVFLFLQVTSDRLIEMYQEFIAEYPGLESWLFV